LSVRAALVLAIVLACTAFLLSLYAPDRSWLHSKGRLHIWYHLALFATLGLLATRASVRRSERDALLMAAGLVGVVMEFVESSRYGGPLEWKDIGTDIFGVVLGGIAGWWLRRRSKDAT
jgi:hypothetical protein